MGNIKIFNMDDVAWYAAATVEDAKRQFKDDTGYDESDFDPDFPYQLPEEEMNRLVYVEDPYDQPDVKRAFREQLDRMVAEGVRFPCAFASTEY